MAQYCAAGFRNKKSTKVFFKLWCKHFYALHTLLLWESQKRRLEPNILTWCSAVYCRPPFPQSLPRFFRVTGAFAPNGKNIRTFTVPFLRRGFSPRSSVLCAKKSAKPCSEICQYSVLGGFPPPKYNYRPFQTICQGLAE